MPNELTDGLGLGISWIGVRLIGIETGITVSIPGTDQGFEEFISSLVKAVYSPSGHTLSSSL